MILKQLRFKLVNLLYKTQIIYIGLLAVYQKKNDKIILKNFKSNIIKSYIVGKNTNFFKSQIQNKLPYIVSRTLKKSVILILKEIRASERKNCTILLSPASASFDQYLNFEKRGEEFKRLCRYYARKYI